MVLRRRQNNNSISTREAEKMNVTLRQLIAFLQVAEIGSFTRASEQLGIAQPALSLLIRELETELTLRLFDRTTRSVSLTDAGQEFRISATRIVEELNCAVKNAREFSERKKGRVTVAAPPLLSSVMVPQAIREFEKDYPGIKIVLADVTTERILEMVGQGEADIGVGTFGLGDAQVDASLILKDSLLAFCRKDTELATLRTISWQNLPGQPLIFLSRASGIRRLADSMLEQTGLSLNPKFEVAHITTALSLVIAGLGVAVLPTYAWAAISSRDDVVARVLVQPEVSREVSIIRARGRSLSPAADAFLSFLIRQAHRTVPPDSSFSM
jgi:DNA-binding transcriptional LysR family regulator